MCIRDGADEELAPGEETIKAEETARMKKIISGMAADFDPDPYADERRKKILKLLKKLAKERGLVEAPAAEEEDQEGPADLVAVLEESMRRAKKSR